MAESKLFLKSVGAEQATEAMDMELRTFLAVEDRLHGLIFPGNPALDPSLAARYAARLAKGCASDEAQGAETLFVQAVDRESEQMAAVALWAFWPEGKPGAPSPINVTWVPDEEGESKGIRGGELMRQYTTWAITSQKAVRKKHIDGPYAFLELCFTAQQHQRKGAASLVMRAGLERADALGLDCFIEASVPGRALYERFGFRVIDHWAPETPSEFAEVSRGERLHFAFMKRPAGGWPDEQA